MTIIYNGFEFTAQGGHTWFQRRARYESDLPQNPPSRAQVTYTVKQTFLQPSFADNQSQYAQLLAALATTRAGLTITDENGTTIFDGLATVEEQDLPAQWGQQLLEVSVNFLVIELVSTALSGINAVYTPSGGAAVTLLNVTDCKEGVKADRYSTLVPNRREMMGSISLSGKVHADPALDTFSVQAYLQQQKALILGLNNSAHGLLAFSGSTQDVQIESALADLQDGTMFVAWSLTARYLKFPAGNYVEAQYTVEQKDALERMERRTSVKGTIRAHDEASARAKVAALENAFLPLPSNSGRVQLDQSINISYLDGADSGVTATFVEAQFTLEYREPLPGSGSYTLTSTDRRDVRSGVIRTTLAGKAYAGASADALALARQCGAGKYPIQVEASEAVATASVAGFAAYCVEVTFSYEYLRRGTWQYAEVTMAAETMTVGNGTQTISGVAIAVDQASATTLARSFKLPAASNFLQTSRETPSTIFSSDFTAGDQTGAGQPIFNSGGTLVGPSQHVKVDFSYAYFVPGPTTVAMEYSTRTSEDFSSREVTTEISGTAYAASVATSDSAINALWAALITPTGVRKIKFDKTVRVQVANSLMPYLGTPFSMSVAAPLAASGDDILEASCAMETIYAQQKTVVTPIPYGTPYVQTSCGMVPGSQTMSGSVTALTEATAVTWARGHYVSTGYPEPAREHWHTLYYPMTGTTVKAYRMDFTYRTVILDNAFSASANTP